MAVRLARNSIIGSRLLSTTAQTQRRMATSSSSSSLRFSSFDVSQQVFLERKNVLGIVNLKPIVPLHVLIITRQTYARISEVPQVELHDLIDAVQETSTLVQRLTNATSSTISIQDGTEAGQSVPHVHVHILPRKKDDFTPNDEIYDHLDRFGLHLYQDMLKMHTQQDGGSSDSKESSALAGVDASDHRKPRTLEQMKHEADWLRGEFEKQLG